MSHLSPVICPKGEYGLILLSLPLTQGSLHAHHLLEAIAYPWHPTTSTEAVFGRKLADVHQQGTQTPTKPPFSISNGPDSEVSK